MRESLVKTTDSLEREEIDPARVLKKDKGSQMSLDDAEVTSTMEANPAQGDPELVNMDEKPYYDANNKD